METIKCTVLCVLGVAAIALVAFGVDSMLDDAAKALLISAGSILP